MTDYARRPGCAPRRRARRTRTRTVRPVTDAEARDAAGAALALITAFHTGTDVDQGAILGTCPPELVLQVMTWMATGFLHGAVNGVPDRDEVATAVLRSLGLRLLEEASR
jgi:hypothetical protein